MKEKFAVAKKNAFVPTIYLGNLSFKITEEGLQKFLSNYGKVTYLYMPRDKKSKKLNGTAFIQFSKKEEYERALKSLNGKSYMGRTLKAVQAVENESMPIKTKPSKSLEKEFVPKRKKRVLKGLDLLLKNTKK